MTLQKLDDLHQALAEAQACPFAWVAEVSGVFLGPAAAAPQDRDAWMQARFFGPQGEVRFVRQEDGALTPYRVAEDPADDVLDDTRHLMPEFGRTLTVRRILRYDDEDGQAEVAATRMLHWEGRVEK